MFSCQELNYILVAGLLFAIYMYISQKRKLNELHTLESNLLKKAYFDTLTSLPNQENIKIILEDQIYRCERHKLSFYTAVIKISDLSDEAVIESGKRLFNSIRREDTVGHIATGTFVIVFNEYLKDENAEIIFNRIRKAFEDEFMINTQQTKVSISLDINTYPDKSTTTELVS